MSRSAFLSPLRPPSLWLVAGLAVLLCVSGIAADRAFPLDLSRLNTPSVVVTDRTGAMLRAFKTADGQWRLPAEPADVAPGYLALLVAVEDRRFWHHPGVDPLALVRAGVQLAAYRRIVSGGSTLTMQVVRLLEPRPRNWRSKLIEIGRALQLEAHLGKPAILRAYLTLAPMGGNLQGVRAGSLAWFGKEPATLSDAEAALLVALPQAPSRLRPDAMPQAARRARDKILARGVTAGVIAADDAAAARATLIPDHRTPLPVLAPHLAEHLMAAGPTTPVLTTTLDAGLQRGVERLLRQTLALTPRPVNLAAIVADWHTGDVLARAGSGDYLAMGRNGMVDMTRAVRSPGSTLKPFIYGMAFDALLAHPASLVRDEAIRFDDYAPHNFSGGFNGDVTVRQALQASLNPPAVMTLQRLGPVTFTEAFAAAGLPFRFADPSVPPGLPIALGGVGTTLEHLVAAYAALADGGAVKPLIERPGPITASGDPLLQRAGADAVADILAGMPPPDGFARRAGAIAYKTGTSYRFRDGWALGFDGSRVVGVWMGRADGGSCPGCVGMAAAGILYRLFDLLPSDPLQPRRLAPVFAEAPPPALSRLRNPTEPADSGGPRITFPLAGSRILVDAEAPGAAPVKLSAEGGAKPFRWLVDGRPIESRAYSRETLWRPPGEGFATITLIDAAGRSAESKVRVMTRPAS